MADYVGNSSIGGIETSALAGGVAGAAVADEFGAVLPVNTPNTGSFEDAPQEPTPVTDHSTFDFDSGPGQFWFELIHYTPEEIELGNILTTVTEEVEIYNSYRRESQTLTSVTNNAGGGITFDGLPSLPTELGTQSGVVFDIVISVDGPPTILGNINVVTDPASFSIPISGSRVVMFAWEPETGIVETLEWKTDILTATDGTEQRIAWRKNPRQRIEMTVRIPDGDEQRLMSSLLKGWHQRVFGVPIWWEARTLQDDAAAGASSVSVDTDYADYREDGLMIIWKDPMTFDAVQIDTVNADSLDLTSTLANSYTAGEALVMPLRVAQLGQDIPTSRFLNALRDVRLNWLVRDNDVGDSFGDTTPFSTHNSKVLLDGFNKADGAIPDDLFRKIYTHDSEIGPFSQFSDWNSSVPVTQKGFYGGSRQAVWETRRLVHALRGSQVSFYLPTFGFDLIPTEGLAASSSDLRIENIGYTDYIGGVEPFKSVWIELDDGTILTRQITDAQVVDSQTEVLTVDSQWIADVALDEIVRISLLQLVRIADDTIQFVHSYPGDAQITMNVRGAP